MSQSERYDLSQDEFAAYARTVPMRDVGGSLTGCPGRAAPGPGGPGRRRPGHLGLGGHGSGAVRPLAGHRHLDDPCGSQN